MKRVAAVVGVLAVAAAGAMAVKEVVHEDYEPFVIVHWSNSHPMRPGLLPDMAEKFNSEDHETASGQPIEVVVLSCDSATQVDDLVARVKGAGRSDEACMSDDAYAANPTIVTPQSGDWLIDINSRTGSDVVDVDGAPHLAETWLGIVTYRDMAECLGWPGESVGYQDIVDLVADPEGWAGRECAQATWGRLPLLAFTNPNTSTSGRNVLVSLYSIAAGKAPGELTLADVQDPEVVQYVTDFSSLVDHYMPGTIPLNTRIRQGPEFGHFFLMPEDNLMSLCLGNEKAVNADGSVAQLDPVTDMVMVYPEEGSALNSNPAAVVNAPWVTDEHRSAAVEWIDFLHDEDRQQEFMEAGFRPPAGSDIEVDQELYRECGLNPQDPTVVIEPEHLAPDVLEEIIGSWAVVKNPAIVTFVVDVSGSMEGEPLRQVKEGLNLLLDAMDSADAPGNDTMVGLVTFNMTVNEVIPPAPLEAAKFDLAGEINAMDATGGTALYNAIAAAIEITDDASGDPRASRSIVVLSDGVATVGNVCLDDLITMLSRASGTEEQGVTFCGMNNSDPPTANGQNLDVDDVVGDDLIIAHVNDVQIFFLPFGEADANIGRLLSEATGSELQGTADENLASVIEALSGYF